MFTCSTLSQPSEEILGRTIRLLSFWMLLFSLELLPTTFLDSYGLLKGVGVTTDYELSGLL